MRVWRHLLLIALLPVAQVAAAAEPGADIVGEVYGRIEAGDCPAAVERLRAGLKKAYPRVALLAGSMVENGICVKASWPDAVTFYAQAHQGGMPKAAERLAAGYADPANGPDAAAALWWGLRSGGWQSNTCAVGREAEQDPDRFVAALAAWPKEKLAACVYVTGVMSTLAAEVKYPGRTRADGMGGEVTLRFLPAVPRIELKQGDTRAYQLFGVVDGDMVRDREAKPVGESLEQTLRHVANRALRRYPQPPGIAPDSEAVLKFVFELE
jgi:hypothetical protein